MENKYAWHNSKISFAGFCFYTFRVPDGGAHINTRITYTPSERALIPNGVYPFDLHNL